MNQMDRFGKSNDNIMVIYVVYEVDVFDLHYFAAPLNSYKITHFTILLLVFNTLVH